jgi:hypothetical protein
LFESTRCCLCRARSKIISLISRRNLLRSWAAERWGKHCNTFSRSPSLLPPGCKAIAFSRLLDRGAGADPGKLLELLAQWRDVDLRLGLLRLDRRPCLRMLGEDMLVVCCSDNG